MVKGKKFPPFDEDGKRQVMAGVSLLECSRLVGWCPSLTEFSPVPHQAFQALWPGIDPVFGRLICWINFSAGAEMLAKGICLLNNVEIRTFQNIPAYPSGDLEVWTREYFNEGKSGGTMSSINYGTLANLTSKDYPKTKPKLSPGFRRLFNKVHAQPLEEDLILAAYEILARTIRNRDAHAYVPNVRDSHFSLVSELFVRCFNILVSWLPNGRPTLEDWRKHATPGFNTALD